MGGVVYIFTSSTPPLLSPGLQLRRSTRKTTVPVHQPLSQTAPAPAPALSVFDPPTSSGVVDDCPVRKLAELLKQQKDDRIAAQQKKVAHALLSRGIKDPHKAVRGDRYVVPFEAFDSDDNDTDDDNEDPPELVDRYGVVTKVERGSTCIWFDGDERNTRYNDRLEAWGAYLKHPDDCDTDEERVFVDTEERAGLRKVGAVRVVRNANPPTPPQSSSDSEPDETLTSPITQHPVEVETWESDAEDDENADEPDVDLDDDDDNDLDADMARAQWADIPNLRSDPRGAANAMPENIPAKLLMPDHEDESWLNFFLWWMPVSIMRQICDATNNHAKSIAWPRERRWKHLRIGEFMRWLGLWILMTVYPHMGERRNYWRGMLQFQRYMSEKRFENILRAFTLPKYTTDEAGWGGPGRAHYKEKNFDKFWEVRKFTDLMKERFENAIKPGGWLCVDECMFSWLGRALDMPGWKVIKRKPHPFGLEAKATACTVTGILISWKFQEGKDPMGHFGYIEATNKSSAWLLRLTKPWHNKERRTVIGDAAFAQVRAAVALDRFAGLFFIGNVKTCHKYFPKRALKEETGPYVRNRLVCLTKKATVGTGEEAVDVFATGWRATGKMVVTYVHTAGTTVVGSDRVKRKYTQMNDGKIMTRTYHVKRPKLGSEYQANMGAIDMHNYRRQSGKTLASLEKICITRNTKDRVFINMVSWVLINVFLAKRYFVWAGEELKGPWEVQELIAKALIHNQYLQEDQRTGPRVEDNEDWNDPADLAKHPLKKKNRCRHCFTTRTIYICLACSHPKRPTVRKESGPKGGVKHTHSGYMHFCKKKCFAAHDCGHVPHRRSKAEMARVNEQEAYEPVSPSDYLN